MYDTSRLEWRGKAYYHLKMTFKAFAKPPGNGPNTSLGKVEGLHK